MNVNSITSYNNNYNSNTNFKGDISIIKKSKPFQRLINNASNYIVGRNTKKEFLEKRSFYWKIFNVLHAMENDGTNNILRIEKYTAEEIAQQKNSYFPAHYYLTYGNHTSVIYKDRKYDNEFLAEALIRLGTELFGEEVVCTIPKEGEALLQEIRKADAMYKQFQDLQKEVKTNFITLFGTLVNKRK